MKSEGVRKMFLETERLILRKIQNEDFSDYCAYSLGNPEQDRMMGRNPLNTIEDVQLNFNWLKDKEERGYVLVYKPEKKVIGNLTVYNNVPVAQLDVLQGKVGRSMSFCLSASYRRRGLMEEAVLAVIERLFQEEGVDYIRCGCFDFNLPSLALQKKLGFTHLITEYFQIDGEEYTGIENILWKNR